MIIPKLHYRSTGNSVKEHLENIQKACTAGVELVQLGVAGIKKKQTEAFAKEARTLTAHYQTRLILNGDYKLAREIKADGVHLERTDAPFTTVRNHLYTWQMLGATAYTLEACEVLLKAEVDYIALGIFKAEPKQETPAAILGLNGYTVITEALTTETPILAFGGITISDVKALLETGVSGILAGDELTTDFNQVRTFNQLLNASVTQEQRHTFD